MESKRIQLARKLVALAKEINAAPEDDGGELKRLDPALNIVVQKVVAATGGDMATMLTIIIMALRKTGHQAEANQIFNIFKQVLKRTERILSE